MLVKFHSKAAADVVMMDRDAQKALALFGKSAAQGTFTVAELDNAIAVLQAAVSESRQHAPSNAMVQDAGTHPAAFGEHHFHDAHGSVDFATHIYPLLEMMRAARQAGTDLTWYV